MHELMLKLFNALRSFCQFMKMLSVFCIILLLFYWMQNLTFAEWGWLGFITPFFTCLIDFADNIYSYSFNFFGAEFELKYFTSIIILVLVTLLWGKISLVISEIERLYCNARIDCIKTKERFVNMQLQTSAKMQELKINNYMVSVNTVAKKGMIYEDGQIDINKQNALMNNFIKENLGVEPEFFAGGFLYSFDKFKDVDAVLDVFSKLFNSTAPLKYSVCVQVGKDYKQLQKLISLEMYGQIIATADTVYRYKFNKNPQYETSTVGLFRYENKSLEVHEFKKIL